MSCSDYYLIYDGNKMVHCGDFWTGGFRQDEEHLFEVDFPAIRRRICDLEDSAIMNWPGNTLSLRMLECPLTVWMIRRLDQSGNQIGVILLCRLSLSTLTHK